MSTILSDKEVKARKDHRCDYCNEVIVKGELYNRSGFVYDNSLYTWKSHLSCIAIASKLRMFDECDDGLTGDDFCEIIKETYMDIMSKKYTEIYESNDFKMPAFAEQLAFVKKENGIKN